MMTTDAIVRALRHYSEPRMTRLCNDAADLIELIRDENIELREEVNLRGNAVRAAERKRAEDEAERDAALGEIKYRDGCSVCKNLYDCRKNGWRCERGGLHDREHWKWSGLPEAQQEEKDV